MKRIMGIKMRKSFLFVAIAVIFSQVGGCGLGESCGHSNDDCVADASCILNNDKYHSCGICACITVEPLIITSNSDSLTDAIVGDAYANQTQITASGGIKPYHWSLVVDQTYLDLLNWLQIDDGSNDGNPAVLSNKPGVYPSQSSSGSVQFRVHVFDSSVKGQKDGVNNKGVDKEVTITIHSAT